jgi:sortase A
MPKGNWGARRIVAACVVTLGALLIINGLWIPAKAVLAQYLLEGAWQRTLTGRPGFPPWPWADTFPVARLTVGDRGVLVLSDSGGHGLAFGPTHVTGSAEPGAPGTIVISAHRDTHFRGLDTVKPGAEVTLQSPDGKTVRYRVTGSRVLATPQMAIPTDTAARRLVLITCWPLDGVIPGRPERFALFAEEAPAPAAAKISTSIRR